MDEVVTMKFTVEFYEKENGEIPVINFIDSLELNWEQKYYL